MKQNRCCFYRQKNAGTGWHKTNLGRHWRFPERLSDSLNRKGTIGMMPTRHEECRAAFAAGAQAQLTGEAAVPVHATGQPAPDQWPV